MARDDEKKLAIPINAVIESLGEQGKIISVTGCFLRAKKASDPGIEAAMGDTMATLGKLKTELFRFVEVDPHETGL